MLIKHSENIFWLLKNSSIEIEMYELITKKSLNMNGLLYSSFLWTWCGKDTGFQLNKKVLKLQWM